MSIINKGNGPWENPVEGLHLAVCVDQIDRGWVQGAYGERHMLELRWQLADLMEDGRPYLVQRRFNATMNEKGNLRPFLVGWRGEAFKAEALQNFEEETLVGKLCQLTIIHKEGQDGRIWANVVSAVPAPKGAVLTPKDYIRVRDREEHVPIEDEGPTF